MMQSIRFFRYASFKEVFYVKNTTLKYASRKTLHVFHYYCWYSKQFEVALTISYHKTKIYVSTTYNF